MKGKKRIRMLRVLAIAGSLSALAVPTAAVAKPVDGPSYIPVRHENNIAQRQVTPYQLPANFRTEVHAVGQPYSLPSNFHSEVQTAARPAERLPFTLPARFKPEVQTPVSSNASSAPAGQVIREIRTVTDDGNTLPVVLAAIALAVALCGTAYVWFRMSRMQRDLLGSSSRPLVS
jgi:hypothetical protein